MRYADSESNTSYHVVQRGTAPQPINTRGRRSLGEKGLSECNH